MGCLGGGGAGRGQSAEGGGGEGEWGGGEERIDTDFCEQLILLVSAAPEIIKPSHTDTSNQ